MDALVNDVQQVFATMTRYPLDVLDPDADLEEDLGIDSVKLAEILAAFREQFALPETLDVAPEQLSSIARIAEVIRPFINGGSNMETRATVVDAVPVAARRVEAVVPIEKSHGNSGNGNGSGRGHAPVGATPAAPTPRHTGAGPTPADVERIILETFVEVTRYPADILTPEAHLEDDLGIDSVKLAEILSVLGTRLDLPEPDESAQPPEITTIADIAGAVWSLLERRAENETPRPPQQALVREAPAAAAPVSDRAGRLFGERAPFTGKIALVTGSGHGIGKAIAVQLAELGATVVVNSFHSRARGDETAAAIRAAGGTAEHLWGSIANPTHLKNVFAEVDARFGGLDFLICNASNGIIAPLKDVSEAHWDRAFRTNVVGLHQAALLAAELMRRRGGGRIVTLSSPGAHRYITHFGCMGPIKAAVETLTLYLAIELGPDNIQVNSVSAGPIYGELLSKYPEADRLIHYWESLSAGQKLGEESDVASFVAYLLSDAARKITGSVMLVDSGGSQRI